MEEVVQTPELRRPDVITRLRIIHEILTKASFREAMRLFREPEDDELIYQFAGHPFQFPEPIRQTLTLLEKHVYEAAITYYFLDVVKNKRPFNIKALQESLDHVQIVRELAFLEEEVIEDRGFEEDEDIGRLIRHQTYRKLMARINIACVEPIEERRVPESRSLYTPKDKKFHWNKWDALNVMNWVRQFISNEQYLDLIEYKEFNGVKLEKFLDSTTEWKTANFPFGLFVQLKIHLNRVINERNGYKYEKD